MEQYYHEENLGYLVVETFNKKMFWIQCSADECATGKKIIQDENNFVVNGWKVARHIPKRIHCYKSWNDFINENCSEEKGEENDYEEDNNDDDDNKYYNYKEEE